MTTTIVGNEQASLRIKVCVNALLDMGIEDFLKEKATALYNALAEDDSPVNILLALNEIFACMMGELWAATSSGKGDDGFVDVMSRHYINFMKESIAYDRAHQSPMH